MIYITVFIFGSIIGSFLNVCIYRLPRDLSIVSPPSRCNACGTAIKFYDNIPILSYLILRGRCRACGSGLSLRYPLVESINALLYVTAYTIYGLTPPWVLPLYFLFISSMIVIFFIDLDHQIIPNSITYPGIVIAVIFGSTVLPDPFLKHTLLGAKSSVIGFLAGGGSFYLIAAAGKAILKKEAMGGGDIKMMAMVGGLLGWKGVILTTFVASLLGSVIGISLIALKGREWGSKIPFGPYLSLGSLASLFWGQNILTWYLNAG